VEAALLQRIQTATFRIATIFLNIYASLLQHIQAATLSFQLF
jgi:hypothetical protein